MSDKVTTQIKCSDCGKTATVNFKPSPDRPVYCRECLPKHRNSTPRTDSGNRMQTRRASSDTGDQAWSRRRESWK